MRERGTKEGSIDSVEAARGWGIAVDAVGTVELDRVEAGEVGATAGENRVGVTEDSRAVPEVAGVVLFDLRERGSEGMGQHVAA